MIKETIMEEHIEKTKRWRKQKTRKLQKTKTRNKRRGKKNDQTHTLLVLSIGKKKRGTPPTKKQFLQRTPNRMPLEEPQD